MPVALTPKTIQAALVLNPVSPAILRILVFAPHPALSLTQSILLTTLCFLSRTPLQATQTFPEDYSLSDTLSSLSLRSPHISAVSPSPCVYVRVECYTLLSRIRAYLSLSSGKACSDTLLLRDSGYGGDI